MIVCAGFRRAAFALFSRHTMEPYIKANSPLYGDRKPKLAHGAGLPKIERRQRDELAAVRRALKKAARREGRRAIDEAE